MNMNIQLLNNNNNLFAVTHLYSENLTHFNTGSTGIGYTGDTGPTGPAGNIELLLPGTGSVLVKDGENAHYSNTLIVTDTEVEISGNFIPTNSNVYTLGVTGARWKDLFIGPGSLNIAGPTPTSVPATIGSNLAGLAYSQFGFVTPFLNIGPQINPNVPLGTVGGWNIFGTGPTGDYFTDLRAQLISTGGSGFIGPSYSLIYNNGDTGPPGPTGIGDTGPPGQDGLSSSMFNYKVDTHTTTPINNGRINWNNANQLLATTIYVSHIDNNGNDVEVLLGSLNSGDTFIIQDQSNSANYQMWNIVSVSLVPNQYISYNVSISSSTHSFSNNNSILLIVKYVGNTGPIGPTGPATNSLYYNSRIVNTDTTLLNTDQVVLAGPIDPIMSLNLTLPIASEISNRSLFIIDYLGTSSTKNIHISPQTPATINGQSEITINTNYSSVQIYSTGSSFYLL
jgi:hypothetical protein